MHPLSYPCYPQDFAHVSGVSPYFTASLIEPVRPGNILRQANFYLKKHTPSLTQTPYIPKVLS